jgi:hypothetical protein
MNPTLLIPKGMHYLKHICPSSFIFGCHIFVSQLATGGLKLKIVSASLL